MVKLVLVDTRDESPTKDQVNECFIGARNPTHDQIPALVYQGWKCIGAEPSVVLNLPTGLYHYADPDEYRPEPHRTLPCDWSKVDG